MSYKRTSPVQALRAGKPYYALARMPNESVISTHGHPWSEHVLPAPSPHSGGARRSLSSAPYLVREELRANVDLLVYRVLFAKSLPRARDGQEREGLEEATADDVVVGAVQLAEKQLPACERANRVPPPGLQKLISGVLF